MCRSRSARPTRVMIVVRVRGLEPPRQRHMILNHARLPFRHTRTARAGVGRPRRSAAARRRTAGNRRPPTCPAVAECGGGSPYARGERRDLNPRPLGPQPSALPTELRSPRIAAQSRRRLSAPPARLAGFEPAAHGLEVRCSIHLSYRRTSIAEPRTAPDRPRRAGDGIRTRDRQLGRLTLYQLSYTRPLQPRSPQPHTWSGREDLNLRPSAPKADALPGCATSRRP